MGWTVMGSADTDEEDRELMDGCGTHVSALTSYVTRLLGGDRYRAEDIVQETLTRCWLKFGLNDHAMLRPWLFTVARNLVIDSHRKSQARPQEVDGAWLEQEASEFDHIEQRLSSVVVMEALKGVSLAHREVLYSAYYLGKSVEETSRDLDIPPGTVKSRLYYGIRSLRLALQQDAVVQVQQSAPVPAAHGRHMDLVPALAA
ncbi:RNA polymerase subunit sigma-70 [Streptomyces sp. WAC 01325]|uniref:sigma-70 family RNA polymerase sigma factor n=1 Tax=Streptomyces sp. WAC 01325 TaxID=2203202 RepID=UPI000F85E9E8|nr:sigma-70 family RNA polymerase sigma factor [Streptomyces sp. WAC 01325]RSM88428.1 RNA polymerase subunit sigma-70 [Streptomyces sp. WAC 01325]